MAKGSFAGLNPVAPCRRPGVVVGLLATLAAGADSAASPPLFDAHEILNIELAAPLKALTGDRSEEPERREATLSYVDENGATRSFSIGIRPRGKKRRESHVCRFPPLRINFRTDEVRDTVFHGQDKLKMVTHCQARKSYQQYVLLEYLAYRVLNLLTENSFRVRLLEVNYNSTDQRQKPFSRYAFLIEDRDHLVARTGHRFRDPTTIGRHELDAEAASMVEVFQFLIGNTDWSIIDGPGDERCCHNAILMSRDDGPYAPVPYDFDYSGIVDTPYAVANKRGKTVRDRTYRGFCRSRALVDVTLGRFREQKPSIYRLFETQTGLAPSTVSKTIRYLDAFYRTINDPDRLEGRMLSRCR